MKQLNIGLLLFFYLLSNNLTAQITFQKTFSGASSASSWHVEQTIDAGYVICGIANTIGPGGSTFLLVKTNAYGDTLWTRLFGGTGGEDALCVKQTNDGGYILSGSTYSFGAGNSDGYLVKTDSTGNLLWSKTYGGIYADDIVTVQPTADGGYILLGSTASFGTGPTDFDVYLIKTNAFGDTLWTKTFGGTVSDNGLSLQVTSDGGYIITGSTQSFSSGQDDVYLLKTDSNGNLLWSKSFGGAESEVAWSVKQTTDGNYIIAGTSHSSGTNNFGDVYLIRADSNGDTLWTRAFGGSSTEQAYCVQQTSDGGFVVLGETYSFGAGHSDFYLVKTDSSGNLLWSKTFGDTLFDHGYYVQQTIDNGFIITGPSNSFGPSSGIYLIKTDANGNSGCHESNPPATLKLTNTQVITPATVVSSAGIVTTPATMIKRGIAVSTLCDNVGITETLTENSFVLYPNPASQNATLEFQNSKNENCTFLLYDSRGQLVREIRNIKTDQIEIERQYLNSGFYFFQLRTDEKIIASGKLVFE